MAHLHAKSPASAVEEQIKAIREEISKLSKLFLERGEKNFSETARAAREEADELLSRTRNTAERLSGRAKKTVGSVEGYIADRPVQSTLIALLVGIFIGFVSRRR
jgi:ElaB/YqjD/DUF883 family membrane-anchored ribosome-binding protein